MLLLKVQLEPSILSSRAIFFYRSCCSHLFVQGLEQGIFDSSYLLRKAIFWKTYLRHLILLKEICLFHHFNCTHPSLEVAYLLFFTERMRTIYYMKETVFILTEELGFTHFLSNSFSSSIFSPKKLVPAMRSDTRSYSCFQRCCTFLWH